MEVVIVQNSEQGSEIAANIIKSQLTKKSRSVLGLATGQTPLLLYKRLIEMNKSDEVNFSKVTTFNLDEYLGLSASNEDSYAYYMRENFFKSVNIDLDQAFLLDGMTTDVERECNEYEYKIKKCGGIDLQVLGLGREGHIGFNEPTSSLTSRTRLKTLTPQTMEDNKIYFKDATHRPFHVLTMGIGTIMESQHILLMAYGEAKAQAIVETVEGPITAMVPASILQMHNKVTVIVDEAAAAKLSKIDYYKWVYENKPHWQRP